MRTLRYAAIALLWASPVLAQNDGVQARWVQLMPGGGAEVRAITTAKLCPIYTDSNHVELMQERAAPDVNFPVRLCTHPMGLDAGMHGVVEPENGSNYEMTPQDGNRESAPVLVGLLPAVVATPQRIIVFGDTGCRIKGSAVQACNDPKAWPFAQIAAQAAALKPDLVVHVGDYLYRESPCPAGNAGCAGSPYGDNWAAWNADFFTPAKPLLHAAPWVFVRGNHEDCARSGPGWLRLLGPIVFDPAAPCAPHLAPYAVPLGEMNLVVMDNASAPDTSVDHDLLAGYQADFAGLPNLAKAPVWAVMHRPIWGAIAGPANIPLGGNETLIAAIGNTHPLGNVSLMLAGHIHTFEVMNYAKGTPPAMVAGFGGDNLDVTPMDLSGADLQGQYVEDGFSLPGFGFLLMTREDKGWRIDVHKVDGSIEEVCHFAAGRIDCAKA